VLISKRLLVHFLELVDDVAIVAWEHVFALLRGLPRHAAMCVLKSWLNGWCTSRRFHEVRTLSCLLGCPAPDTFAHYDACPRLWNVVAARTHGQRSANTIERLGLVPGARQREAPANLALAYTLYHELKIGNLQMSADAIRVRSFAALAHHLKAVAYAHAPRLGCR
jgi:hypothetical protein